MALQIRRGTQAELTTFVPAEGEPVYTTDSKRLYVGDGLTPGGIDISVVGGIGGPLSSNLILNNNDIVGFGNISISGLITTDGVFEGNLIGNVTGSVYADASTLLVDAVNGLVPAEVVQGTFTGTVAGDVVSSVNGSLIVDAANSMFYGNVIGNLLGDITGNVTGNVTGSLIGKDSTVIVDASTLSIFTPEIVIGNNLTIIGSSIVSASEDITFQDTSVSISTVLAQSSTGLSVFGNTNGVQTTGILKLFGQRGSDINVPEILLDQDNYSAISFNTFNGSTFVPSGFIAARVDGTPTPNADSLPTKLVFITGAGNNIFASNSEMSFDSKGVLEAPIFKPTALTDVTERDSVITNPSPGMMIFISSINKFQGYVNDTGSGTPGWMNLN